MSITSSDLEHQLTRFGLGRVAVLRKTLAALTRRTCRPPWPWPSARAESGPDEHRR